MATNSTINVLVNNKIYSSYCHYDGDLNGKTLLNHYNNFDAALELIKGGSMSSLKDTVVKTDFYMNYNPTNPEYIEEVKTKEYDFINQVLDNDYEYNYFYMLNSWITFHKHHYKDVRSMVLVPLSVGKNIADNDFINIPLNSLKDGDIKVLRVHNSLYDAFINFWASLGVNDKLFLDNMFID